MNPKVTIIMATYNRAHFIVETLKSIQEQTFQNWECLIIDDGGTDNTFGVITPILNTDPRFQFSKRPNKYLKGLPGCRNYGLDQAKGEFVIFFDDDDIVHPNNLKINLEVIQANEVDFCHFQKLAYINTVPKVEGTAIKIQNELTLKDIENVVNQKIGLASCTVLWHKKCFESIRFNESLLYAEEWECYTRIISEGFVGVIIENVLYYNRKHANSNTGEFYKHNPVRRRSNKEAILLVIANLKGKDLLSQSIIRYFVKVSVQYKEYNLFYSLMNVIKPSLKEKMNWLLFYKTFSIRWYIYKWRKKLNLTK